MSERKFAKGLAKPGTAAQLRETVSQVVRETTVQSKPQLVEPLDFENFIQKNKTVLQNDPQRELLIYPQDDVAEMIVPRKYRTLKQSTPDTRDCNLFAKQCVKTYSSNWHVVQYKYVAYGGSFADLPHVKPIVGLPEDQFEVDLEADGGSDVQQPVSGIAKEGYLMKGPELGSERTFPHIGSKSFKRRYCNLRQEVDGTYMLEMYKDEKKGEAKVTIVMDFCRDVVKNARRGRFCFELLMTAGHKGYVLAAENDADYVDWLTKLSAVVQQRIQEEKRERERGSPPPPPPPPLTTASFGTLKGLEHSMNPQLIRYARETDLSIGHARKEKRRKLMQLYPPVHAALRMHTPHRDDVEPYRETFGHRILIKCQSLVFKLQTMLLDEQQCQLEPYYTTMALYDARNAIKLSENFHFDVNDASARALIPNGVQSHTTCDLDVPDTLYEWLLYPRQALFSVTNPHCDVFVVVRIDKVLQGAVCTASEPYVKPAKDAKNAHKALKSIALSCQRLAKYRMPFAWAAKPLFRLYSNELDTSADFPAIYRQEGSRLGDEELLKLLAEYRKPDKFSKMTVIPGNLKMHIAPLSAMPNNCLNASLAPIKPFPIPPQVDATLEIAEFPCKGNVEALHPYTSFVHHLYVYPQTLNFDTQKMFTRARNIACVVELRNSDAQDAKGLECVYSRPGHPPLVQQASCVVLHHNTTPTWYEEIKIRLPINLQPSHHLLFSFYHISCDVNKKKETIESSVGYAWLPLLKDGRFRCGPQTIAIASHLPPKYLSIQALGLSRGNAGPEVTWVDGQRPIFSVHFNLISSVIAKDQCMLNLFAHAEKLLDVKPIAVPSEKETCTLLKQLYAIDEASLITYAPTLFNQLFVLLVRSTSADVGINIIKLLINLVQMMHNVHRKEILDAYVRYVFVTPDGKKQQTAHEEMSKHLPTILAPANADFLAINYFMHRSDFFFDIMTKSMAQHLLRSGRIKMHRNERFSTDYMQQIEALVKLVIDYILDKHKEKPQEVSALNKSFSLFVKHCLSLMDRGFVFRLIAIYVNKFAAVPAADRVLNDFKYAFLAAVCSHEHYVGFNLPISHTSISPKNKSPDFTQAYCLSETFCRHHFIVSLLLQEVRASLNELSHSRRVALATLRDLIAKHELDDRYQNRGQLSRIALIYVPWLNIVLENINRLLSDEKLDECSTAGNRISTSASYLFKSSVSDTPSRHRFTLHFSDSPVHIRNSVFFDAIAGQSTMNGQNSMSLESELSTLSGGDNVSLVSQDTTIVGEDKTKIHRRGVSVSQSGYIPPRYDKLPLAEVKEVLVVFLFIVKHLSEEQMISWWQKSLDTDIQSFFSVLDLSLHTFKYMGKRNVNVPLTPAHEPKTKSGKAHTLPARMNPAEINNHETHGTLVIHAKDTRDLVSIEMDEQRKAQAVLEQNLANECGLIVLDLMGLYFQHFHASLMQTADGNNCIMRKVFDIYITFLEIGQGEALSKHVFASLRSFINNYSAVLFQGNATLCGRLCYELLRSCNSRLASVRQESCAVLYLLMRSNFEFTGRKGITRVHLQVIISVSQILGSVIGLNNARFQESLSLVNSYASSDKAMKGTGFPIEVKDLTKRIRTVLMATVQMKEHHHDPEMLVDLQHSLANSYASTPELRHTWLENMSRNHVRDGNFSEAACCQLHIVALIAEYLKLKKIQSWGAEFFDNISSNIARDERGLKLDAGVQDVQYSEYTLLLKLETCVEYIDKSERCELLGELYKLILPIYEKKRDYPMLQACYSSLAMYYGKVIDTNRSGKRLLGRFYRVALHGQAFFEEESSVEYVYKEPKVTSLSEISERLHKQYCEKFSADNVRMIQDSNPIDPNQLDRKYAYIQVTHVTPYFEKCDYEERQTDFEQNHDINCFMFETPFTKEGKAQGSPREQWKRRTILTTEYSFPYVTKRIKVTHKKTMELSPIEVAIDEMQNRVNELEDVVFSAHTDTKRLQLVLQGSVYVQVNAGPLAYASAFLDPTISTNVYPEEKVEELKDIYREFIKVCYSALQKNSKVISQDQREYQEVMRTNYIKMCGELSALFGESLWPHDETGSFKRNSTFSPISGMSHNSSTV